MPEYKYKVLTRDGKKEEGIYLAESENEVLSMIRGRNWYPLEVELANTQKDLDFSFLNKVKLKDISIFCRQFATMINSGISIMNVLEVVGKQTQHKKFKATILEVHEDVQKGTTFSESLKQKGDVFPPLLTSMVEAGEASGNLDVIMNRMAVHYEKEYKINNKVKSAMMYPVILGIVAFIVIVFLLLFVVPSFVEIFESSGTDLPAPTKILLAISQFLQDYFHLVLPGIGLGIFGIVRYFKTPTGTTILDRFKLNAPILKGPIRDIITARFTRTLSVLFGSGVPLIQALDITASIVQNVIIEDKLLVLKEDIKKGYALSSGINEIEEFPHMMKSMIGVGEESGTLDDILDKTANFYDEEVDVAVERLTSLIEPLMIIFMAGIVGFIVVSIAMPMFGMFEAIQSDL